MKVDQIGDIWYGKLHRMTKSFLCGKIVGCGRTT